MLTYAELFAGAGGLSMGLETAGWRAAAHAEIDPHARAVLREHWPDCRLDGDVTVIDGADYAGVTLLSGGSPCQDLSVAGKRAGMTEDSGTRSSLYFEQVRIWRESGAPYFLWENVLGAFSSNAGRDFAAVLSALVGAAVPVPDDGWRGAGVASGPTGVAAWRVLDCQYFGPPQRRRRVFVLGARAGGVDPAEVLALSEGVRGDTSPRGEAGEGLAADARGGATLAVNISDGAGQLDRVMGTLGARSGGQEVGAQARGVVLRNREGKPGGGKGPLAFDTKRDGTNCGEVAPTLRTMNHRDGNPNGGGQMGVVVPPRASANDQVLFTMASGQANAEIVRDGAPTLINNHDGAPILFTGARHDSEAVPTDTAPAEAVRAVRGADDAEAVSRGAGKQLGLLAAEVLRPEVHGGGVRRAPEQGDHISELALALEQGDPLGTVPAVREPKRDRRASPGPRPDEQRAGEPGADLPGVSHAGASGREGLLGAALRDGQPPRGDVYETRDESEAVGQSVRVQAERGDAFGIPRRLTPRETEALQGWPRNHTAYGIAEDGTHYALSDTARYRLVGNGVASPVAAWIGWRLRSAIESIPHMQDNLSGRY